MGVLRLFIFALLSSSRSIQLSPRQTLFSNLDKVSRKLVKVLRHKIVDLGLICDSRGYVAVEDIVNNRGSGIPRSLKIPEDLVTIVDANEKKRLELEQRDDGRYYMRAVQGHNTAVGSILDTKSAFEIIVEPLEFCAHGTEKKYVRAILSTGLKRMSRQHIHLVSEIREDRQVSGYKTRSNAIVVIDMEQCMRDGMIFLRSANGVILTEGFDGTIPLQYIKDAIRR